MKYDIIDNGKRTTLEAKNRTEARRTYRLNTYPGSRALPKHVVITEAVRRAGERMQEAAKELRRRYLSEYPTPGASGRLRRSLLGSYSIGALVVARNFGRPLSQSPFENLADQLRYDLARKSAIADKFR